MKQGRLDGAYAEYAPVVHFCLFSGGHDSLVLVHLVKDYLTGERDGVLHINTGIGIEQTRDFARGVAHDWWLRFYEWRNPDPRGNYERCLMEWGFPGPQVHQLMYQRLKERALEDCLRSLRSKRGERFALFTGVRANESVRRMGNRREISRKGGQVWINPLTHFTSDEMHEYRERHDLPRNEVADHLHMSGECLCGAFARPGQKEEIRFFYPETAAYLDELEVKVKAMGHPNCRWGQKVASQTWRETGPMCSSCDQMQLIEQDAEPRFRHTCAV